MKLLVSVNLKGATPVLLDHESFLNGYPYYSGAMICPVCLDIWATLAVEGQGFFELRCIPCEHHSDACHLDLRPVAGSLLDNPNCNGWDTELLELLPEALVKREFSLHLNSLLLKEINNECSNPSSECSNPSGE